MNGEAELGGGYARKNADDVNQEHERHEKWWLDSGLSQTLKNKKSALAQPLIYLHDKNSNNRVLVFISLRKSR